MAEETNKKIENKKEKLELLKNLFKLVKIKWKQENVEQLLDLVEVVCKQYLELYVKPYFGAFSEHFAPLEFERNATNGSALGNYSPIENIVTINIGDLGNKIDTMLVLHYALDYMSTIGHEYEHNFQYKGGEFKDLIIDDKEKFKASVEKIVDKFAYDIVDKQHDFQFDDRELKAILTITNSFDTLRKIALQWNKKAISSEELLKFLNDALYFNRFVEIDARAVESKIFTVFTKEMTYLTKYRRLFSINFDFVRMETRWQDNELNESIQPGNFYKKIYDFYVNLVKEFNKSSLLEYTEQFVENSKVEYYKTLKQHLDSDEPVPEASRMAQHDIIENAFNFLSREFSEDYTESSWFNNKKAIDVRLCFAQMGFKEAGDFSSTVEYTKEYQQKYFELLKSGDITLDSFFDVNYLDDKKNGELLSTYIDRGQIEYANRLISECNGFQLLNILRKSKLLKHISNRLNVLENADLQNKKDIAFDGKHGTFDDIDDMINFLSKLFSTINAPYYFKKLSKDQVAKLGDEYLAEYEILETLYKLYKKAEEIGRTAASKIAGRELSPTEYRYAHPEDRDGFLIKIDKAKRFKRIYGNLAYYNIQQHEQTLQKVDKVLFDAERTV